MFKQLRLHIADGDLPIQILVKLAAYHFEYAALVIRYIQHSTDDKKDGEQDKSRQNSNAFF